MPIHTSSDRLDFDDYDIEFAELLSCAYDQHNQEISLAIQCPVSGWSFKRFLSNVMHKIKLDIDSPYIFLLNLTFIGVVDLQGDLLELIERESLKSDVLRFEIDSIHSSLLDQKLQRFYLRCENRSLDFTFQDCIFRQIPISE